MGIDTVLVALESQWPNATIDMAGLHCRYLDFGQIRSASQSVFDEWHKNSQLMLHVGTVQTLLSSLSYTSVSTPPFEVHKTRPWVVKPPPAIPSLARLLENISAPAQLPPFKVRSPTRTKVRAESFAPTSPALRKVIESFQSMNNGRRKKYGDMMSASLEAHEKRSAFVDTAIHATNLDHLQQLYEARTDYAQTAFEFLRTILSPSTVGEQALGAATLWPVVTRTALLGQLSGTYERNLPHTWTSVITAFATAVARAQRSERLVDLSRRKDFATLKTELANLGQDFWSAIDHPTWLLLEIENNLSIRDLQAKVAVEMIMPSSNGNSVLQLNMGEGKSSVITPMVATSLADGNCLVRIVVLKPLMRQTEQILVQRLGGLLGRRIYIVPVSRSTRVDRSVIEQLQDIYEECKAHRGVLIALPEQILSLRLLGRERMSADVPLANSILATERWLALNCRDVLDESDQILDPRFQLIYTVGSQQMLDGQPERWLVIRGLLDCVASRCRLLANSRSDLLEVESVGDGFPTMHFLSPEADPIVTQGVVQDVVNGYVAGLSFQYYSQSVKDAIASFISNRNVNEAVVDLIKRHCEGGPHWKPLLVLRGVLAYGVLSFALQKERWLVDYGNDHKRCLMSVPYRAKGVPSISSEFGHPEVALIFTHLSYYYGGLSDMQIETCFKILLRDPNAGDEYDRWCSVSSEIPSEFRSLEAINLEDVSTCHQHLFPCLRKNVAIANFYMKNVVFPKEGKEFATKISASSWDLPSMTTDQLTTGFSGTNDNRFLLPSNIQQKDLPELHHTNAMVLDLLLRPENQRYTCAVGVNGKRLEVCALLSFISRKDPASMVLLDVGAQVLETNQQVAREWLKISTIGEAALFYDDNDDALILDRKGIEVPLRLSTYRTRLGQCLIYLDEAHTRGIDLPIPAGARAAVTLGPRLVKDRLVQACMRLRKLGNGHSLGFFAPPEVHQSILTVTGKTDSDSISSSDVIAWTMEQTCQVMERAQPLRLSQGLDFLQRRTVCQTYLPEYLDSTQVLSHELDSRFWEELLETESRTLDQMYGWQGDENMSLHRLDPASSDPIMQHLYREYKEMQRGTIQDAILDEEQEREVAHEIERERQVQRPLRVEPQMNTIAPGLRGFVRTGHLEVSEKSKVSYALDVLKRTSAGISIISQRIECSDLPICVTEDSFNCIRLEQGSRLDEYLAPVNWIVTSVKTDSMLVISAHEANVVLPELLSSKTVRLHTFSPRLTKSMVSFDDMDFYTVSGASKATDSPSKDSIRMLNIFAGSLYMNNYAEYLALCDYLGIVTPPRRSTADQSEVSICSDGFAERAARDALGWPEGCPFVRSPILFLKDVFSLRFHGQDFEHTHMGDLVHARVLRESDFVRKGATIARLDEEAEPHAVDESDMIDNVGDSPEDGYVPEAEDNARMLGEASGLGVKLDDGDELDAKEDSDMEDSHDKDYSKCEVDSDMDDDSEGEYDWDLD